LLRCQLVWLSQHATLQESDVVHHAEQLYCLRSAAAAYQLSCKHQRSVLPLHSVSCSFDSTACSLTTCRAPTAAQQHAGAEDHIKQVRSVMLYLLQQVVVDELYGSSH
jgi:hypothetical protein